ncbi:BON domain-containing protein [Paraburkholderia sp. B3]|uniref:BON domain-containing protein n=1 Tax=Paraburkholderia sp. B3 TaxID=3134791 RepID=UPI0039824358
MKIAKTGLMVVAGLLTAAALSAHAQGDASSAPAATAAPQTGSAATPAASKAADRALRRRILTALGKAKGLRAAGITVRVNSGAVLLQGWVPEQAMIDQATQVAQTVPGVTSVKNTLTLSTF